MIFNFLIFAVFFAIVPTWLRTSASNTLRRSRASCCPSGMNSNVNALSEKIQTLSAEQISEVEGFVEFIRFRRGSQLDSRK
jgi:hypothetical protein